MGPDEVEVFVRGWVDSLAVATEPDGAPDFVEFPGQLLLIGPFKAVWAADAGLQVHVTVDVNPQRPAEPVLLAANFTRSKASAWRYCRNDHHLDVGRDHLHLHGDSLLVGLPDPLTLNQLTARLLAEPR